MSLTPVSYTNLLEPEGYFDHEDFLSIFDFNTPEAVAALGTAVSQSNQQKVSEEEY